jgi:hypothetical protein
MLVIRSTRLFDGARFVRGPACVVVQDTPEMLRQVRLDAVRRMHESGARFVAPAGRPR